MAKIIQNRYPLFIESAYDAIQAYSNWGWTDKLQGRIQVGVFNKSFFFVKVTKP